MKWSELLAELKTNVAAAQQRRADVEEIKDREALLKVKNEDDFREWGFPLLKEKVRLLFPDGNDSSRCRDRIKELEDRVNETNVDLDRELDAQIASTDVGLTCAFATMLSSSTDLLNQTKMEQFLAEQGRDAASQIVPLREPDLESVLSAYEEIQVQMQMEFSAKTTDNHEGDNGEATSTVFGSIKSGASSLLRITDGLHGLDCGHDDLCSSSEDGSGGFAVSSPPKSSFMPGSLLYSNSSRESYRSGCETPDDPTQLQFGGDDLSSVTEDTQNYEDGDLYSASPRRSLSPARLPLQPSKPITPVSHDHQKNDLNMLSNILTNLSSTSEVSPNYTQGIQ
ncbi:hypothetical protein H4I96_02386 [Botrytis cinerea]